MSNSKNREINMAVRRVSDLPNLDECYPASELSNCLIEVSYAQPTEPRRYQSFYENALSLVSKIPYIDKDEVERKFAELSNIYVPWLSTTHLSTDIDSHQLSVIPDCKAVHDYISASNFMTVSEFEKAGITNLKELVNGMVQLINRKNVCLFVAQNGVNVDELDKIGYNIQTINNQREWRTLTWERDPHLIYSSFSSDHYDAKKDDLVFYNSIATAMTVAQRFKFLEASKILIYVCTDIVEPFTVQKNVLTASETKTFESDIFTENNEIWISSNVCLGAGYQIRFNYDGFDYGPYTISSIDSYSNPDYTIAYMTNDNFYHFENSSWNQCPLSVTTPAGFVKLTQSFPTGTTMNHSDDCEVQIRGIQLKDIQKTYKRTPDGEDVLSIYNINWDEGKKRVFFRDNASIYNSITHYNMHSNIDVQFIDLIFDGGTNRLIDQDAYPQYILNEVNALHKTYVNKCAFIFSGHRSVSLIGGNFNVTNCSFVNCYTCLAVYNGSRSEINGNFEVIKCSGPAFGTAEGGSLIRGRSNPGLIYVDSIASDNNSPDAGKANGNGIVTLFTNDNHWTSLNRRFLDIDGNVSSLLNVKTNIIDSNLSDEVSNFILNPEINGYLTYHDHNLISCNTTDAGATVSRDDFRDFIKDTTGTNVLDNAEYNLNRGDYLVECAGYSTAGYMTYYMNTVMQYVISKSSYLSSSEHYLEWTKDHNSRLYKSYDAASQQQNSLTAVLCMWDNEYLKTYNDLDGHQLSSILSNEAITSKSTYYDNRGAEMTNMRETYNMMSSTQCVISPSYYSFKPYRNFRNTGDSMACIPPSEFATMSSYAEQYYNFTFTE